MLPSTSLLEEKIINNDFMGDECQNSMKEVYKKIERILYELHDNLLEEIKLILQQQQQQEGEKEQDQQQQQQQQDQGVRDENQHRQHIEYHQQHQTFRTNISSSANDTGAILKRRVKVLCKNATKQILRVSETQLSEAINMLHKREEKRIQLIMNRYEEKLRMSRKSHRLEREQQCFAAKAQSRNLEEKLESYYEDKLLQANMEIEKYVEMSKVQDKTLYESQQSNEQVQRVLQEAMDDHVRYKTEMESKITRMKDKLECKRVYGIWTRFQIAHLRRKRRLAEQALIHKQKEYEKMLLEVTELKSKLSTSKKIRNGLEKAFEKRAEIRGLPSHAWTMRLKQQRQRSSLTKKPSTLQRSAKKEQRRINCVNSIGVQVIPFHGNAINTKDVGVDAPIPAWYHQEERMHEGDVQWLASVMRAMMPQQEHMFLYYCRKELENMPSQSYIVYRHLLSGTNFPMLLPASKRDVILKKTSLDGDILCGLTNLKSTLGRKFPHKCTEASQRNTQNATAIKKERHSLSSLHPAI